MARLILKGRFRPIVTNCLSQALPNALRRWQTTVSEVKVLVRTPPCTTPHAQVVFGPLDAILTTNLQMALDLGRQDESALIETYQEPLIEPPGPTPDLTSLPDPARWARALSTGVAESLAGTRPPQQLIRWLDFHIYRALVNRCPKKIDPRAVRPVVTSVKTFAGAQSSVEACSVVRFGSRSHAFALQFRPIESKWRCCSLIIG